MNTFGDDIEDFIDIAEKAAKAQASASQAVASAATASGGLKGTTITPKNAKNHKSMKVKFKTLNKYVITELALLDNSWVEANWQIVAQESLENGDLDIIDDYAEDLTSIEAKVEALFQLGRYFGIPQATMTAYIPNINDDYARMLQRRQLLSDEESSPEIKVG